jgi:N-acetylmuramoyl-L-alanine amidase
MTRFRMVLVALLVTASMAEPGIARAQAGAIPSAERLFAVASAEEAAVRKALSARSPSETVLKAVRTVIADFESVVRHYPRSGYCDDALWRAAMLSRDAFEKLHEAREYKAAVRMLKSIGSEYPSSKFVKDTRSEIAALDAMAKKNPSNAAATASTEAPAAPQEPDHDMEPMEAFAVAVANGRMARASSPGLSVPEGNASLKDIRRAVLPELVRIVIELDREVPFHDERLENPSRIFVDLASTEAIDSLEDQTIRFESDADVVRQVRLGRHPGDTTRVVLDTDGVSSYSVYPLYNPFRLVIDCLRDVPLPSTPQPTPTPVPSLTRRAAPPAAPPVPRSPASFGVALVTTPAPLSARRLPTARVVVPVPVRAVIELPALASRHMGDAPVALPDGVPAVIPRGEEPSAIVADAAPAKPESVSGEAAIVAQPVPGLPSVPTQPVGEASRNLGGGFSIARQLGLGVSRIVIDPGHGGRDPGAKGNGIDEATLVLDIALRLEKLLAKTGVEVVLTRRTDEYIPLQERTAIANRENADLFLSIHANASRNKQAHGVETYFLNFTTNLSASAVAARENAASGQTMGALPDVVKTIALNNKLDESKDLATYVQREMVRKLKPANKSIRDLGVKQAPFVVLIGAAMPSVLAEVSFLTNAREGRLLKSSAYRQRIANGLFDALRKYQSALKSVPKIAQKP